MNFDIDELQLQLENLAFELGEAGISAHFFLDFQAIDGRILHIGKSTKEFALIVANELLRGLTEPLFSLRCRECGTEWPKRGSKETVVSGAALFCRRCNKNTVQDVVDEVEKN